MSRTTDFFLGCFVAASAATFGLLIAGCATTEPAGPRAGPAVSSKGATVSGQKIDRTRMVEEIVKETEKTPGLMNEFHEMVLNTDMADEQLGAFMSAYAARNEKWTAWENAHRKRRAELAEQLGKAQQENLQKRADTLRREMDAMKEEESNFRKKVRAEVMNVMTLDQQRDWATYVLWEHWGGFGATFSHVELTDKQVEQARAIVRKEMNAVIRQGTVDQDPYLHCLKSRGASAELRRELADAIVKQVLTPEQRKRMRK